MKKDSTRYFAAIKEIESKNNRKEIMVKDKEGKIAVSENEQINITTTYFKQMLAPESSKENFIIHNPKEMTNPFVSDEIKKAANKLKNGKSPGPDEIEMELKKYAPMAVYNEIADIYNVAKHGEKVIEITLGLLRPLQKPKNPKGPVENLGQ